MQIREFCGIRAYNYISNVRKTYFTTPPLRFAHPPAKGQYNVLLVPEQEQAKRVTSLLFSCLFKLEGSKPIS